MHSTYMLAVVCVSQAISHSFSNVGITSVIIKLITETVML